MACLLFTEKNSTSILPLCVSLLCRYGRVSREKIGLNWIWWLVVYWFCEGWDARRIDGWRLHEVNGVEVESDIGYVYDVHCSARVDVR